MNLLKFNNLSQFKNLVHFQTTHLGSDSQYFCNVSYCDEQADKEVFENRCRLAKEIGVDIKNFVFIKQTHSDNVHIVNGSDIGRGVFYEKKDVIENTDAVVTNLKNVVICVKTADCIPVTLYDPVNKVVAVVHSGWQGTKKNIVSKTISVMSANFRTNPIDILAGIGVGAQVCCYEVGKEFLDVFDKYTMFIKPNLNKEEKYFIDLKSIIVSQLKECGIENQNIEVNKKCSICNSDVHFSYRGSKGLHGRSLSGICML